MRSETLPPTNRCFFRRIGVAAAAVALLFGGSISQADHNDPFHISVSPNPATSNDPLVVTVTNDGHEFCSFLSDPNVIEELEVVGIVLSLQCPPPSATSYPAHFVLDPLPAGLWDIQLLSGDLPISPPAVLDTVSLTITDPNYSVQLEPSPATEDDIVVAHITGLGLCPVLFPPEIEQGLIRLKIGGLGTCDPPGPLVPFATEQSLGQLAAGDYLVELFFANQRVAENTLTVLPAGTCVPRETTLCLDQGRFRVEATWSLPSGLTRPAQTVELTDNSGAFWFLDPNQVELLVRVVDACTWFRPSYWVFAGGATNLGVTIEVTDTSTGATQTYESPTGEPFETVLNTAAFLDCP